MSKFFALTALAVLALSGPAYAQDVAASGLPEACRAQADTMSMGEAAPADEGHAMGQMTAADEAHTALMAGMKSMNDDMAAAAMAENIDVAFVCSMIPHHQGAIDMARAELKYGTDEWAKAFAQKVIDAQTQEIADMTKWIEEHAQ